MKTHYFECACYSNDHTIKMDLCTEDKEFPDLYLSVQLNQWNGIFKRIWLAIKYIFGRGCRYGHWDTWMLKHDDVNRLRNLLETYWKPMIRMPGPT